jgi:hypothetical protein
MENNFEESRRNDTMSEQTIANTFPIVGQCPKCGKIMKFMKPGNFLCSGCKSAILIGADGIVKMRPGASNIAPFDKMAGISKIFELTNAQAATQLGVTQMFEAIKQSGATDDEITTIRSAFDTNALLKAIMSTWGKYYSDEDVAGILQFYQSPAGRKMIGTVPLIEKETEMITQQLLQAAAEKLSNK